MSGWKINERPGTSSVRIHSLFDTSNNLGDYAAYGISGCGVFKRGIQKEKGFWLKITCSQMKSFNFAN